MSASSAEKQHLGATPSNFNTPVPLAGVKRTPQTPGNGSPFLLPRTPRVATRMEVDVNDDEAERRQRRLQKNMCSMISPGCHTPRGVSGSAHSDRSRAVESSSSSLTDAQLSEHYANCIKLSSQNKISSKNAFGLHLIDHMFKLLKMRGEMSNFQIASSTLDAGAKIYAGRVDSIYNDIFKVLGGLGREQFAALNKRGKEDNGDEEGEAEGGEAQGKKTAKKSKKSASGSDLMLEKNPNNLIGQFDMASRMDPLFQKTAAAFDEGGVEGLLLNNLIVQDDGCSLTLDASQKPVTTDQPAEGISVHVEEGLLDRNAIQTRQICPTFANFKFNTTADGTWSSSDMQSMELGGERRNGGVGQDADFTMLDCPPTAPDDGAEDDQDFEDAPAMDAYADQTFTAASRGDTTHLGVLNDNQVARFMPAVGGAESGNTTAPGAGGTGLGDLCLTDLIAPSDYSYFNPSVMASWAGPQHWKFRPRNALTKKPIEKDMKEVKAKRRKVNFKMDFTKTPEKALFASGKASTQLSKAALSKLDSSQTTLPRDIHTDVDVLHRLFSQPKWKVRRQRRATGVIDENLEGDWYDYQNANDQLNYIPPPMDEGGDSDDAVGEGEMAGMDETAPGFSQMSETILPPVEDAAAGDVELGGANLVVQPRKVDQVRVDFARSSKKIDIKKLKSKMWDFISQPAAQEEEVDSSQSTAQGVEFSSLYSELPSNVSSAMAKNLSVPICFVSLLHLANEKELRLEDKTDLSDFTIFTA